MSIQLICTLCENGEHDLSYLSEGIQQCACACHGERNRVMALERLYARAEVSDRPTGPYIRYGWCHWCHADIFDPMDHEQCEIEMNDDQIHDQYLNSLHERKSEDFQD